MHQSIPPAPNHYPPPLPLWATVWHLPAMSVPGVGAGGIDWCIMAGKNNFPHAYLMKHLRCLLNLVVHYLSLAYPKTLV